MKKQYWIRGAFIGLSILVLVAGASGLAGCAAPHSAGSVTADADHPITDVARLGKPRLPALSAGEARVPELVEGNAEFAMDLYHELFDQRENLFYSPHSLSMALAITYAGARGETEQQMAQALHYTLHQAQLHPAFNALDQTLAGRSEGKDASRLHVANSLWGQQGTTFLDDFLDIQAEHYGAELRVIDFGQARQARRSINQWVSDQTENRIPELLPPDSVDGETALILANAIYFDAAWMHPFDESATHDGAFTLLDGGQVTTPMMEQAAEFGYAERTGVRAVELGYAGGELSMVILLPEDGAFAEFAQGLDVGALNAILDDLRPTGVRLTMPKFRFDADLKLKDALMALGLDAFDDADFSGMDGTRELFIDEIYHKAFIAVDEAGTEAAAATAVVMARKGETHREQAIRVDRPFLFLIRDIETGAILFLGHVMDPTE